MVPLSLWMRKQASTKTRTSTVIRGGKDKSRDRDKDRSKNRDRDKDKHKSKDRHKDKDKDEHRSKDRKHRGKDDKRTASPAAGERKRDRDHAQAEAREPDAERKRHRSDGGATEEEHTRGHPGATHEASHRGDDRVRESDRRPDSASRYNGDRGARGRYERDADRPAARSGDAHGGARSDRDQPQARPREDARAAAGSRHREYRLADRAAPGGAERDKAADSRGGARGSPTRDRGATNGARQPGEHTAHAGEDDHGGDASDGEVQEQAAGGADTNGADAASGAGPMSLEEVLQRKKAADAEAAKPKFMSRKEREALALAKCASHQQAAHCVVRIATTFCVPKLAYAACSRTTSKRGFLT